jgi:hypothetical protein
VESVMDGILRFEAADAAGKFDSAVARSWAGEFATAVFLRRMREFVLEKMPEAVSAMTATSATEGA